MAGVSTTLTDQCQFGQQSREGNPVLKPTKWMSNCEEVLEALNRRSTSRGGVCSETGTPHQQCSGRTAKEAAIYPFAMCQAILEGLRRYLDTRGRRRDGINAILPASAATGAACGACEEALSIVLRKDNNRGDVLDATTRDRCYDVNLFGKFVRSRWITSSRRMSTKRGPEERP